MNVILSQEEWRARARDVLPGGGFGNFDPGIFIRNGKGSRVWDQDGNEYVDFLIGSGPMLLGHGNEEVEEAILEQIPKGLTFFANNVSGVELAEKICEAVACAEQVRFLSSGGEADMYAIRLARAATGRDKIIKFEGGYHGMSAEAQMSLAPDREVNFPQAIPDSAGIPEAVRAEMLIAPFNDLAYLENLMAEFGGEVAGLIVEPLQRTIPAQPGFLAGVRELCDRYGVVLIFDEIVTGFRLAYGGAQEAYGVIPDICTLGKIIGGGFPLAAVAGSRSVMRHFDKGSVDPDKWLMMLGTLSGNPVAAVAGMKTMEILQRPGAYDTLRDSGRRLMDMLSNELGSRDVPHRLVGDPTLFDVMFLDHDIRNYREGVRADSKRNAHFNQVLRQNQILKSPGKLYPHMALVEDDFDLAALAINKAAQAVAEAIS